MVQPKDTNPQDGKANNRLCGEKKERGWLVWGYQTPSFSCRLLYIVMTTGCPSATGDTGYPLSVWPTPTPLLVAFRKQAPDIACTLCQWDLKVGQLQAVWGVIIILIDNFCIALFSGVHKLTTLYNTLLHWHYHTLLLQR